MAMVVPWRFDSRCNSSEGIDESGLEFPAVGWKFVQPEIAKLLGAFSCKRAAYGFALRRNGERSGALSLSNALGKGSSSFLFATCDPAPHCVCRSHSPPEIRSSPSARTE
jgi:hypothetical protein